MKRLSDNPAERLAQCRGESVPPAGAISRNEAEQFLVRYHAEVWAAAESEEEPRAAYDEAGRQLAKSFLARFDPAPAPPAGDVEVKTLATTKRWFIGQWEAQSPDQAGWHTDVTGLSVGLPEGIELVDRAHVTRLTAERDGLLAVNDLLRSLLSQASGMVNGASTDWHYAVAKELNHGKV